MSDPKLSEITCPECNGTDFIYIDEYWIEDKHYEVIECSLCHEAISLFDGYAFEIEGGVEHE